MENYEAINRPPHYGNGRQVIDVIEHYGIGFHLGNAIKYLVRAGKKPKAPMFQDVKKALWYLERRKHKMGTVLDLIIHEDIQELTDHFLSERGQIRDALFYLFHQIGRPNYKHLNKSITLLQQWTEQQNK